jgi:two-component system, OmpR family, phosphate regulon sensor histidine kinase PhoR
MKLNRNYLLITASSLALLTVLIIQVNWIVDTARIKEELFNEKAIMVLSKTAEALSLDKETVRNLQLSAGRNEARKVDSLFNHYMKFYNIHIDYFFEVGPGEATTQPVNPNIGFQVTPGCYTACIQQIPPAQNGLALKLVFPEKDEFIMAEMGMPFIASVILILVVLVMSGRTILSLEKERSISQHTTDFLNNMTHEFKTPLTNIALAGKMISKDQNINNEEKIRQYSGIILDENEKLAHQVEQVLSMTALERGEIPLQRTVVDLHELISNAVRSMSMQVDGKRGRLVVNLLAPDHKVNADKLHLTNALVNLIDNAIKYSHGEPDIMVRTSDNGDKVRIEIKDNGIGIDDKYHHKIFESFFRVPTGNVHDVKGFGLGLAYSKKIIELHGGSIELESEPGQGTTFTIELPHA